MSDRAQGDRRAESAVLAHEYDGIREYDNPTPGWWKWIFAMSTVWAAAYFIHLHLGWGESRETSYAATLKEAAAQQAQMAMAAPVSEESLAKVMASSDEVAAGRAVFAARCASCHGQRGEGLIGPNLTDDHALHGHTLLDIRKVIDEGVLAKGMLAWGKVLSPQELLQVTAFVGTLRGTNVPGGKAPQGELASVVK